jgi:hypothetical protein
MEEAIGSATLVEAAPEAETHGVTTTLPRAEVEEVLRLEDGPIELYLDLLRPEDGEARTVRVGWDHDDLERILDASSGETITLGFDRGELEKAFEEADVEGHGLRERALVLTVAVATAAGATSVAQGALDEGASATGSTGSAAAEVAGYQRAMPSDYGVTSGAVGAAGDESPAEVTGGAVETPSMEGYQRAMPSDYGVTSGAVGAAGDQSPAEVTGGAGEPAGGAVGASGGEAPAAVTGAAGQPEFVPGVTDFPSYPVQQPAQQPSGEGTGISIPEPARDAAIAGGIALLITAAGFALKGQRRRIERPA